MADWKRSFQELYPDFQLEDDSQNGTFSFRATSIRLRNGSQIFLPDSGVTVIVGPNNSGKSTLLREVVESISAQPNHPNKPRVIVDSVDIDKTSTFAALLEWMGENASLVRNEHQGGFQRYGTPIVAPEMLDIWWNRTPNSLGNLEPFLVFYGDAQNRLGMSESVESRTNIEDVPTHPLHALQDNSAIFERLRDVSREIFGRDIMLDELSRRIQIRLGRVTVEVPRADDITPVYRSAVAALPTLSTQGDGMRSLLGQLLPIMTASYKIVMLDEPEAFLHPPQAHAFGRELGKLASGPLQLLIATHDRNIVAGLLESDANVSVVRLDRSGDNTRASVLDPSQLKTLWTDPVLRYTNVLDGLFHRVSVLLEAEGDCAFLNAAMDSPDCDLLGIPRSEILTVPCGGKAGMSKIASALTAAHVQVVCAPDLDILSDKSVLKKLVESVGAKWTETIDELFRKAVADLCAPRESVKVDQVLDTINACLNPHQSEVYSSALRGQVCVALRSHESPWIDVKRHGLSAFRGDSRTAIETLLNTLDDLGVTILRDGELESLASGVSAKKGTQWLELAFSRGEQNNQATQLHVGRILSSARRGSSRDIHD